MANFISGIIILFERPVRVGDVVTIGETTGSVARIRIRATTIRNWDKQELLVPNKEFITGRLLNWTLSDNLNRIVINVGVDYGSDVTLALALLEEAVRENSRVLEDPEPRFTFEGFGDNALNLVVRCYPGFPGQPAVGHQRSAPKHQREVRGRRHLYRLSPAGCPPELRCPTGRSHPRSRVAGDLAMICRFTQRERVSVYCGLP